MINQRVFVLSLQNMSNFGLLNVFLLVVTLLFLPVVNSFAVELTIDQHDDLDSLTILGLLAAAETDIEAGRYIEPTGKNAYEKVKKILAEDANNMAAARILAKILKINIEALQSA